MSKLASARVITLLILTGCSSDPSGTDAGVDQGDASVTQGDSSVTQADGAVAVQDAKANASDVNAGGDATSDVAAICTTLSSSAPAVKASAVAVPKITPKGGVIADGVYHLTEVRETLSFNPDAEYRRSFRFTTNATVYEWLVDEPGMTSFLQAGKADRVDDTLTFTKLCGTGPASYPYAYTAEGDTLTVVFTFGGNQRIFTYSRIGGP